MLLLGLLVSLLRAGSPQEDPRFRLQVPGWVTVQEGLCVLVPCAVHYPPLDMNHSMPLYGYWFWKNTKREELLATNDPEEKIQKPKPRFQLLGEPGANNCSLKISGAQKRDSTQYYFCLGRGAVNCSYRSDPLTVTVTEFTQTPDIHTPEPLESGRPGRLMCFLPGACKPYTISWVGAALRGGGLDFSTPEIQLSPSPQDHGTQLTCRVTLSRAGLSTERTVLLSVSYAPQRVTIAAQDVSTAGDTEFPANTPHLDVQQGQALRLLCSADSQPPATLSWVLEGRVLSWSSPVGSRTLGLELAGVKAGDSGRYTCQAENRLGSLNRTLTLSVLYPPEDLRVTIWQANRTGPEVSRNGSSVPVLEGQSLRLVCVSRSNPPARLSWAWVTRTLSPAQPSEPGVVELPVVGRGHEGEFTCAAQNRLGTQSISLSLSVHYPPQIPGPSCSWEAEGLHCTCSSRAWPAPTLRWRLGEGPLEGNRSNASFTVTSSSLGPWANSSLSLHGGFDSNLSLSCEAQNDFGTQRASVLLLPIQGRASCPGASVLAAVGAAAAVGVLLTLSACVILLRVKAATRKDEGSGFEAVCRGPRSAADSSAHHLPPVLATPFPEEELGVLYASLLFKTQHPRKPQDREEASSTEYSEIRIRKQQTPPQSPPQPPGPPPRNQDPGTADTVPEPTAASPPRNQGQ